MRPVPLLRYLRCKRGLLAAYMVFNPLNSVLEILLAYASAAAVNYAVHGSLDRISSYILLFGVYIVVWLGVSSCHLIIRNKILEHAVVGLRSDVMDSLLAASSQDFHKNNTGTYWAHLTSDLEIVRNSYFFEILSLYGKVIQFIVALVALLYLNGILGLFVILMAALQILIPLVQKRRIVELGQHYSAEQQNYTKNCKETLGSYTTAALFGIGSQMSAYHKKAAQRVEHARFRVTVTSGILNELSFAAGTVMYLGIFLIGAVLTLKGYMTVGAIVAASQLMVHITHL